MKRNTVAVRCPEALLIKLDEWRRGQPDAPTRAIALCRIAEHALASTTAARERSHRSKRKAADMAAGVIDHLGDRTTSVKRRAKRKRNLIQGPQEFREIRRDQSKRKS